MAGSSMTFTYDDGADRLGLYCGVKKVIVDWVSDDSAGTASGTTAKIVGRLVKGVTDPSAGGTAPSDDYDITITDSEGVNVLANCSASLSNRDTANTEEVYFTLKDTAGTGNIAAFPVVCDTLGVAVAAAGNSKAGQLILYYMPG
jgi:hypothetical protein